MARVRPGLAKAVNEILMRHGANGKPLSFRQAERLTGLSPATIGELAKGNARTAETVRRFAQGMDENAERLLLLAGFVPTGADPDDASGANQGRLQALSAPAALEPETQMWLERWARALASLPPCRERDLFIESLRRDAELMESFLQRFAEPPFSREVAVIRVSAEEDDGRRIDLGNPESAGGDGTTAARDA